MGWLKTSSGTNGFILDTRDSGNTEGFLIQTTSSNTKILFSTRASSTASNATSTFDNIDLDTWVFVVVKRTESGTVQTISINGKVDSSTTVTARNITGSDDVSRIGLDHAGSNYWRGSLALWRIGAGAPSAEDIEFIYKQEKPLVVNGARATLGGSSDAIASLAWDDYKKQLYAQSGDYLTTIQGSTIVATEASTADIVEASDGEVIAE